MGTLRQVVLGSQGVAVSGEDLGLMSMTGMASGQMSVCGPANEAESRSCTALFFRALISPQPLSLKDTAKRSPIATNGITLHVVELGQGTPVLFCHGSPNLWRGWRRQMVAVAAAGYRALAVDMRGYGRRGKPSAGTLADAAHRLGSEQQLPASGLRARVWAELFSSAKPCQARWRSPALLPPRHSCLAVLERKDTRPTAHLLVSYWQWGNLARPLWSASKSAQEVAWPRLRRLTLSSQLYDT